MLNLHSLVFTVETNGSPRAIAELVREVRGTLSIHDLNPPGMTEPLMKRLTVTLDGEPYPDPQ
jgi:hypothetical protein